MKKVFDFFQNLFKRIFKRKVPVHATYILTGIPLSLQKELGVGEKALTCPHFEFDDYSFHPLLPRFTVYRDNGSSFILEREVVNANKISWERMKTSVS